MSSVLALLLVSLGLVGYAYSQAVVTTTTTRVVTVPPTTYVTEVTVSGTTALVTIELPGFILAAEHYDPGRVCVVYFTVQQASGVVEIPGITVLGTTTRAVLERMTVVTTVKSVVGGTTSTYTGYDVFETVVHGVTLLYPAYGVKREVCEAVTVTDIITFLVTTAPATVLLAYQGFTFPGTTVTIDLDIEVPRTTVTRTTSYEGLTTSFMYYFPGTTTVHFEVVNPTTWRETVTRPGTTYVETYTTVITLTQTTTTARATTTPIGQVTQGTTTPTMSTPTRTTATAPQPAAGLPIDLLLPVAAIAVILVAVVIAFRFRG